MTRSAPHHVVADSALDGGTYGVRRTRSGDAWAARERARAGDDEHAHSHASSPDAVPGVPGVVLLGMPSARG